MNLLEISKSLLKKQDDKLKIKLVRKENGQYDIAITPIIKCDIENDSHKRAVLTPLSITADENELNDCLGEVFDIYQKQFNENRQTLESFAESYSDISSEVEKDIKKESLKKEIDKTKAKTETVKKPTSKKPSKQVTAKPDVKSDKEDAGEIDLFSL
jgi:hypothetical protein